MLKFYLFLALCAGTPKFYSQNAVNEMNQPQLAITQPDTPKSESTPTIEEQGFKALSVNGKLIYRKEINGVLIEFIPGEK